MPTQKNPEIDNFLTSITGISRQDAAEKKVCTTCRKSITSFKDELSKKEYQISGMCQQCQDSVFDSDLDCEYDDEDEPAF